MARTLGGQRRKVIEIRRIATAGMQCCTALPARPEKTTTERCFFFGRELRFSLCRNERARERTMISTSAAAIVDAATETRKESNSIELVEKKTWKRAEEESNSIEEDRGV